MDMKHAAARRLLLDRFLGLLLRPYKQQMPPRSREVANDGGGLSEHSHSLLQINNMDTVARPEDIGLHLGIPPARLVTKMDSGLQKLFHRDLGHKPLLLLVASSPFIHSPLDPPCGHRRRNPKGCEIYPRTLRIPRHARAAGPREINQMTQLFRGCNKDQLPVQGSGTAKFTDSWIRGTPYCSWSRESYPAKIPWLLRHSAETIPYVGSRSGSNLP